MARPIEEQRAEWVDRQTKRTGSVDFGLHVPGLAAEFSFLVLGNAGESGASQLLLLDKALREGADTAFAVLCGGAAGPLELLRAYRRQILAVPGPRDWRDGLAAFMARFGATQPNLYFYLDTPGTRLVFADTGDQGGLGPRQLAWLRRVSLDPKPKILVLGLPIYAGGRYDARLAEADQVVRNQGYSLVISGGPRNFQRYRITAGAPGRQHGVWHVVAGGAGARLDRTDHIPLPPEGEDFDCYPTREQSAARFPKLLPGWLTDHDRPPYYRSFLKVGVHASGLRVQVFAVEDFGPQWVEAPPCREWLIAY